MRKYLPIQAPNPWLTYEGFQLLMRKKMWSCLFGPASAVVKASSKVLSSKNNLAWVIVENILLSFNHGLLGCLISQVFWVCWQVISDEGMMSMLQELKCLHTLELQHCLGQISRESIRMFKGGCGLNLTCLRLERVTPWMEDSDVLLLSSTCPGLCRLSFVGCQCLTSGEWNVNIISCVIHIAHCMWIVDV